MFPNLDGLLYIALFLLTAAMGALFILLKLCGVLLLSWWWLGGLVLLALVFLFVAVLKG